MSGKNKRISALPSSLDKATVSAITARKMLQQHIQRAPVVKRDAKGKSEFAREMLMFPLSVKNPGVAMQTGGRGRRRRKSSITGPVPEKDITRDITGPER